jgi:exodeoxyribonuclease V alpha subunit
MPNREPLSGIVERVTYHNPDNGNAVLRVKIPGRRDLVTVIGHAATVALGEHLQASGRWEDHREHGQQLRATFMRAVPPSSLEGIEKYLGSGPDQGDWSDLCTPISYFW